MFATVERSTAAICSNVSFHVTQIWSACNLIKGHEKAAEFAGTLRLVSRNIPGRGLTQSITTT